MAITSSPLLAPDDVARHTFTTVRRGFDPKEVRAYLESLAHGLTSLAEREQELLEDLAATERRAQNPVLDEAALVAALGQQTARVLHSAHEVADEQLTKAKEEAERLVSDATEQAQAVRTSAESETTERMAAIEAEAERLVAEATERSSALIEGAQQRQRRAPDSGQRGMPLHGRGGAAAPSPSPRRLGQSSPTVARADRAAPGRA